MKMTRCLAKCVSLFKVYRRLVHSFVAISATQILLVMVMTSQNKVYNIHFSAYSTISILSENKSSLIQSNAMIPFHIHPSIFVIIAIKGGSRQYDIESSTIRCVLSK